jgi:hypothetical protein
MRRRFRRSQIDDRPVDDAPADRAEEAVAVGPDPGPAEGRSFDELLARQLDRRPGLDGGGVDPGADPGAGPVSTGPTPSIGDPADPVGVAVDPVGRPADPVGVPMALGAGDGGDGGQGGHGLDGGDGQGGEPGGDFWDRYDRAAAEAALARVPPASVIAVVGPLDAAIPVVRRCRHQHWMGERCDVFVLTQRRSIPDHPDWIVVAQPSDLVAVLEDDRSDFPVLVLDVPSDLPSFVRPLTNRLRQSGVGLVHYVLDGDPDDEDLATWHGELGRPSVLDLAAPVEPTRILELFDRGEPVVSVAGMSLTTELLLALRVDVGSPAAPA